MAIIVLLIHIYSDFVIDGRFRISFSSPLSIKYGDPAYPYPNLKPSHFLSYLLPKSAPNGIKRPRLLHTHNFNGLFDICISWIVFFITWIYACLPRNIVYSSLHFDINNLYVNSKELPISKHVNIHQCGFSSSLQAYSVRFGKARTLTKW